MKTWTLLIALTVCGCQKTNPYYCKDNPDHNCTLTDGSNAMACTTSSQCTDMANPVCDTSLTPHVCVPCTPGDHALCLGTSPVCGMDDQCHACTAHSQCTDSNTCLPDGSCAATSDVAYADPSGTANTTCSLAMPCTLTAALLTDRKYVKIHGTIDEANVTIANLQVVTLLGDPGAALTRTGSNGPILTIKNTGTDVTIVDLAIQNAPNDPSGIGISVPMTSGAPNVTLEHVTVKNNPGGGVFINGGKLVATRSTISGNAGGGVAIVGAQFDLRNDFIIDNGNRSTGFVGGVVLANIPATSGLVERIDFDTIADNLAQTGVTAGISCSNVLTSLTFSNDIAWGNDHAPVGGSNCAYAYSDLGPSVAPMGTNIDGDPAFVGAGDYHIQASSAAKDAADMNAMEPIDVDGNPRPSPPTLPRDMGAHELQQ